MKKLIIILLFTIGLNAQVKTPGFIQKTSITGIVEIEGHESKAFLIFEANLKGIRIYDRDTNKEYQLRECDKEKCGVIHLVPKLDYTINGSIKLSPWLINNTTTTKGLWKSQKYQ